MRFGLSHRSASGRAALLSRKRRDVFAEWRRRRAGFDYHEIERHYYSIPYRFAREPIEARFTARMIELFHKGERIAAHCVGPVTAGTPRYPSICRRRIGTLGAARHSVSRRPCPILRLKTASNLAQPGFKQFVHDVSQRNRIRSQISVIRRTRVAAVPSAL